MDTTLRNLAVVFCAGSLLVLGFNNCSNNFELQQQLGSTNTPFDTPRDGSQPSRPPGNTPAAPMPTTFSANAMKVCPAGCDYSLPSQAIAAAKDGALIEIMSGNYADCISVRQNQVTVRGVGSTRPHLHSKLCDGKGIITNYGMKNRFENIELSGFANDDFNGAGVRQDVVAKDVIISNFYFHNGQMGILGGSAGDRIRINQTEFKNVGILRPDGEISVPVFISAGASLQIRASTFLDSVGGASFIKARTEELSIDCSTIANLESEDSYNIDYQTGGKLSVTNSVIEQSNRTANTTMVGINSVSYNPAIANTLTLKGNIFLNDAGRGTMVNIFRQAPSSIQVDNNSFIGGGNIFSNGFQYNSSNEVLSARPSALGAYPSLPKPGDCLTSVPQF